MQKYEKNMVTKRWNHLMNHSQCTLNARYRIYPKILYLKSNVQKIIYIRKHHLEKTQMNWRDLTLKLPRIIMSETGSQVLSSHNLM